MGKILKQMSGNGKAKVKNEGFYEAGGGFRGGETHGRGRGENIRKSVFVPRFGC
jgi:hypothetical protein